MNNEIAVVRLAPIPTGVIGVECGLDYYESEIAKGMSKARRAEAMGKAGAFQVGAALRAVRDRGLYREKGFTTLYAYAASIGVTRGPTWKYMQLAEVLEDVPEIAGTSHAEALIPLDRDQRPAAYGLAAEIAGGEKVTQAHVREAASRVAPEKVSPEPKSNRRPKKVETVEDAKELGYIAPDAEAYTYESNPGADPEEEDAPKELDDLAWLETLPAREKLSPQCRAWFDADALAFRRYAPHRQEASAKLTAVGNKAKKAAAGHIGVWLSRALRFFHHAGPTQWKACGECGGTGQMPLIGNCAACRGNGYHV